MPYDHDLRYRFACPRCEQDRFDDMPESSRQLCPRCRLPLIPAGRFLVVLSEDGKIVDKEPFPIHRNSAAK